MRCHEKLAPHIFKCQFFALNQRNYCWNLSGTVELFGVPTELLLKFSIFENEVPASQRPRDRHLSQCGNHASVTWFAPHDVRCSRCIRVIAIQGHRKITFSVRVASRARHKDTRWSRAILPQSQCMYNVYTRCIKSTFTHPARDRLADQANRRQGHFITRSNHIVVRK